MKVALARNLPPVGPSWFPIDCRRRQGIAPLFGQLECVPASICPVFAAHTLLVSNELCHVTLPLSGTGFGVESLGLALMLVKCVITCTCWPKIFTNKVASGRALGFQAVPPVLVGRQV